MKNVNLLPEWYVSEQAQRRRLSLHFGLMLALGLAMTTWHFIGQGDLVKLRSLTDQLRTEASMLVDPKPDNRYDHVARAMALDRLRWIDAELARRRTNDAETAAHRQHIRYRIERGLDEPRA